MGSTGAHSTLKIKLNAIKNMTFKEEPFIAGMKYFVGEVRDVGRATISPAGLNNSSWIISVAKPLGDGNYSPVDIPQAVKTASSVQAAEKLVKIWLENIAKGKV